MGSQLPTILVCFAVPEESAYLRRLRPELSILHTGMGENNAVASLESHLQANQPELIISAGFAGGLDPALSTGTVIADGLESPLPSDSSIRLGTFHCAARVATTVAEKTQLRDETGCDAVEMESTHLRNIAGNRGIQSWTLRVISDAANEPLPLDFNSLMTRDMKLSLPRLLGALARRPAKIGELLRFQRRIRMAAQKLGEAIDSLLPSREESGA